MAQQLREKEKESRPRLFVWPPIAKLGLARINPRACDCLERLQWPLGRARAKNIRARAVSISVAFEIEIEIEIKAKFERSQLDSQPARLQPAARAGLATTA